MATISSPPDADFVDEFKRRTETTVWCTLATTDLRGRPRTRIVHPVWDEDGVGWMGSRPTPKLGHLTRTPSASLMYWDPRHAQVIIDADASVHRDAAACKKVWELFVSFPEPYGFDPAPIWSDGPEGAGFVVVRFDPWRIELFGAPPIVWRRAPS